MVGQATEPVTTYETILGQVLRQERERQGLSQAAMAQRAGVTQPYWSKVEQGRANPSIGVLRRASTQLGMTYGELASRTDRVSDEARERGVVVLTRDETEGVDWLPILGAAAIGALIGIALARGGGK